MPALHYHFILLVLLLVLPWTFAASSPCERSDVVQDGFDRSSTSNFSQPDCSCWFSSRGNGKQTPSSSSSSSSSVDNVNNGPSDPDSLTSLLGSESVDYLCEQFAAESLSRITEERCLSDLKLWLQKYPVEVAKRHFTSLGFTVPWILAWFDYDLELTEGLFVAFAEGSESFWKSLLQVVKTAAAYRPEVVAVAVEAALRLNKTDCHIKTILFYALSTASALANTIRNLSPAAYSSAYTILSPMAGRIHAYDGHDALFLSLLNGHFSSFELKRLFFFEPRVQVDVVGTYLAKNGPLAKDGLLSFNLLASAVTVSLHQDAVDLILDAVKLHVSNGALQPKSSFKSSFTDFEAVLTQVLHFGILTRNISLIKSLIDRFPALLEQLESIVSRRAIDDITADPFWQPLSVALSRGAFDKLCSGQFDRLEFLRLCAWENVDERADICTTFLERLRAALPESQAANLRSRRKHLIDAVKLTLEYSKGRNYAWAATIFEACHEEAPAELPKLLRLAELFNDTARVTFLLQFFDQATLTEATVEIND